MINRMQMMKNVKLKNFWTDGNGLAEDAFVASVLFSVFQKSLFLKCGD